MFLPIDLVNGQVKNEGIYFHLEFNRREPQTYTPVHIINIDIPDNHEEATLGAFQICELCEKVSAKIVCCQLFCKIAALKNFQKSQKKHQWYRVLFVFKMLRYMFFLRDFTKLFRTFIFSEDLWTAISQGINVISNLNNILTHFKPRLPFCTPRKQKNRLFDVFR